MSATGSGDYKQNRRKTGTVYEEIAASYLTAMGYRILAHSFRCRMGEIDLIAVDPGINPGTDCQSVSINDTCRTSLKNIRSESADFPLVPPTESGSGSFPRDGCLVFIEVKYRKNAGSGHPEEAVSFRKQAAISRVADYYRLRRGIGMDLPCRFDVIAIEGNKLRHWKNAFPYAGF